MCNKTFGILLVVVFTIVIASEFRFINGCYMYKITDNSTLTSYELDKFELVVDKFYGDVMHETDKLLDKCSNKNIECMPMKFKTDTTLHIDSYASDFILNGSFECDKNGIIFNNDIIFSNDINIIKNNGTDRKIKFNGLLNTSQCEFINKGASRDFEWVLKDYDNGSIFEFNYNIMVFDYNVILDNKKLAKFLLLFDVDMSADDIVRFIINNYGNL